MTQPTVCCVMLVNGREEMVKRAVRSFKAQTYERKVLLIWDTAPFPARLNKVAGTNWQIVQAWLPRAGTIGTLRNNANQATDCWQDMPPGEEPSIICHWDSDDWSHPNRIEEQVALLQATGKDCVGYREMLFWNATPGQSCGAWLYRHAIQTYCLGTSFCYWRRVWEQRPFEDLPRVSGGGTGEDTKWLEGVQSLGVISYVTPSETGISQEPRMIATIHGANTNQQNYNEVLRGNSPQWKRVPEWDGRVRSILEEA